MTASQQAAAGEVRSPAISVLVPIYNVERYLDECLASLAAQTFAGFEVLCINDGSTDGSRDIIQRYLDADPRFRVIDKPNSGYGASMNRGLAESRGEFIAILESDDFLEPNGLQALHEAAISFNADVVKANFWLYWSTPTERNKFYEAFTVQECGRVVDPSEETEVFHAKPSIWSAMYRKSLLTDHGIDFLETPGASFQDLGFTFKVWACARRVVFLYNSYVHYRQDNENSSVNSMGKVNAVFDEYAEIGRWLGEHPEYEETFGSVKASMMYDSCIWNYERVAEKHKVELLVMAREALLAEQKAGHIDIRDFKPWKLSALRTIMVSPATYHRNRVLGDSVPGKMMRLLTHGSARDIASAAKRQLGKLGSRGK